MERGQQDASGSEETLGAHRAVSPNDGYVQNLSKFWKINLKTFSHKSGKLIIIIMDEFCCLTENNEEGGEPYGTVP